MKLVKKDLLVAQKVLDDDHYGLVKVKERIIEYLAVQQRKSKMKGPIMCLVGPPGVGKTSLGKYVAQATGREFRRISLGGLREESEISVYLNAYSGEIVAIRSLSWRLWDLMWGLHIMDWQERDNINNILLKLFSILALISSITGLLLFFKMDIKR